MKTAFDQEEEAICFAGGNREYKRLSSKLFHHRQASDQTLTLILLRLEFLVEIKN